MEHANIDYLLTPDDHNRREHIDNAVARLHAICKTRGVRLTDSRLQVFKLICQHKKPLGAYLLLDLLEQEFTRHISPQTIYRALKFLLEQGFIHRIQSLSAFVSCSYLPHEQRSHYLVCRLCEDVVELQQPLIDQKIYNAAVEAAFTVETQSLEVRGICKRCNPSSLRNFSN